MGARLAEITFILSYSLKTHTNWVMVEVMLQRKLVMFIEDVMFCIMSPFAADMKPYVFNHFIHEDPTVSDIPTPNNTENMSRLKYNGLNLPTQPTAHTLDSSFISVTKSTRADWWLRLVCSTDHPVTVVTTELREKERDINKAELWPYPTTLANVPQHRKGPGHEEKRQKVLCLLMHSDIKAWQNSNRTPRGHQDTCFKFISRLSWCVWAGKSADWVGPTTYIIRIDDPCLKVI